MNILNRPFFRAFVAAAVSVSLVSCQTLDGKVDRRGRFIPRDQAFADAMLADDVQEACRWASPANVHRPIRGNLPITFAAAHGNRGLLNLMLDYGADIHSTAADGRSLVYVAASNGHADLARQMRGRGVGLESDLADGAAAHAQAQERSSRATAGAVLLAGLFLAVLVGGGGGGSSGSSADEEDSRPQNDDGWYHAVQVQENRSAAERGAPLPHPGVSF